MSFALDKDKARRAGVCTKDEVVRKQGIAMSEKYNKAMEEEIGRIFGKGDMGVRIGRGMGLYIVMYDLSDGYVRNETVKILLRQGFRRMQYSVYIGCVKEEEMKKVRERISRLLEDWGWETDSVMIVPINNETLAGVETYGKEVDIERVINKGRSLFF